MSTMSFEWLNMRTVSYTHLMFLDKLIPVAWVAEMTQRRCSTTDTSELPEELQELLNRTSNDLSSDEIKELRPVSYTHLDVYKRQHLSHCTQKCKSQ